MNPHEQSQSHDKSGHQAAANLAFATSMSQMLQGNHPMQQGQAPNAPQDMQEQPQQEETQTTPDTPEEKGEDVGEKMKEMELSMTEKLDAMRKELKADQQREMDGIKKTITDALG